MSTDLAVIEAALAAALSADEVLAGISLDYTPSEWGRAKAASEDFDAASREYVAELVERVKAAEAMLDGRCLSDITHRDDEHRQSICMLAAGHATAHDDGKGCRWTDGEHYGLDPAEATIARVRELAEQHPGTAWNSGLNLRQALRDALGGTPTDAPEGAGSADDERNRFSGENADGATEPILRPTDQRYEPPAVDDESGCCRG